MNNTYNVKLWGLNKIGLAIFGGAYWCGPRMFIERKYEHNRKQREREQDRESGSIVTANTNCVCQQKRPKRQTFTLTKKSNTH